MHICVVIAAVRVVRAAYQGPLSIRPSWTYTVVYVCCGAPLAVVLPVVGCAVPSGVFSESKLIIKF